MVLCPGTPEGSTGSCSGFKASQKTGQRLKVSFDRLGEAGNRTCDPWGQLHVCTEEWRGSNFCEPKVSKNFGLVCFNVSKIL